MIPKSSGRQTRNPYSSLLMVISAFWVLSGVAFGQEQFDSQALLRDTQKTSQTTGQLTMVWWIPEQFWQAAAAKSNPAGSVQSDALLKVMRRYTLIAVVDSQVGPLGGITYKSEELVRNSVTLNDSMGVSYSPLADTAIDADMRIMLQLFKPIFTNAAGPLGQNMHFLLFPSTGKGGQPLADAKSTGSFDVVVAGKDFKYVLPLASVLPFRYDAATGEKFPGTFNFNPITGARLVNTAPPLPAPPLPR